MAHSHCTGPGTGQGPGTGMSRVVISSNKFSVREYWLIHTARDRERDRDWERGNGYTTHWFLFPFSVPVPV